MYNIRKRILFSSRVYKPIGQLSLFITLITWQNTACVHTNVDVKFSMNDAFLE